MLGLYRRGVAALCPCSNYSIFTSRAQSHLYPFILILSNSSFRCRLPVHPHIRSFTRSLIRFPYSFKMMLLFRSTFITAVSALVVALCMFSMSGPLHFHYAQPLWFICAHPTTVASAVPQFGRPFFHVLDATAVSESMLPSASYLAPVASSTTPTSSSGDPDPDPQIAEAPSSTSLSALPVCV